MTIIVRSFPMKGTMENHTAFYGTDLSYLWHLWPHQCRTSVPNSQVRVPIAQLHTPMNFIFSWEKKISSLWSFIPCLNFLRINLPHKDSLSSCSSYRKGILRIKEGWATTSEKYQNSQKPENTILKWLAPSQPALPQNTCFYHLTVQVLSSFLFWNDKVKALFAGQNAPVKPLTWQSGGWSVWGHKTQLSHLLTGLNTETLSCVKGLLLERLEE